jgi:hypothetical protein
MGEWKAPLTLRVRQGIRAELEQVAAQERRTLGNLGTVLIEWSFERLKAVGSIDRLLKVALRQRTTNLQS